MIKTDKKKSTKKKASSKKANPRPLTFKEIKDALKSKGVKLEADYEEGEYILYLEKDPSMYASIGFDSLDNPFSLDDVYQQGLRIAKAAKIKKKANPKKCRVIKVRRKISMGAGKRPRILQVRRKVCNPSYKNKTEYNSNKAYKDGFDIGFDYGEFRGKNPYERGSQKWRSFMSGLSDGTSSGGWDIINDGS